MGCEVGNRPVAWRGPMLAPGDDPDWRIRLDAFQALEDWTRRHGPALPWSVLAEGFASGGQRLHIANRARGIFWPKVMKGGALSLKTTIPRGNRRARYQDESLGDGLFRYKFQGEDPEGRDNRRLHWAYERRAPLVYFYPLEASVYQPIWPVLIEAMDPHKRECTLVADDGRLFLREYRLLGVADAKGQEDRRRYATVQVQRRLHQTQFRQEVLRAYQCRCAVCHLPRPELLDAAHIVPDRDETGVPEVPNGLALCKLHHGVFDTDLMGIRPDGIIELSQRLRDTHDGPTLRARHQVLRRPAPAPAPAPGGLSGENVPGNKVRTFSLRRAIIYSLSVRDCPPVQGNRSEPHGNGPSGAWHAGCYTPSSSGVGRGRMGGSGGLGFLGGVQGQGRPSGEGRSRVREVSGAVDREGADGAAPSRFLLCRVPRARPTSMALSVCRAPFWMSRHSEARRP